MKKKLIFVLVFSLIFLIKCDEDYDDSIYHNSEEEDYGYYDDDDYYYDRYGYGYFKASLKEYLVENKLFNSDRIIEPDEMKKIFLDVVTEGPDNSPDYLKKTIDELADYFVELYYNEKRQIKGKDIYKLIDIEEISMKFDELTGENPSFNEEEDDLDSLGKPKVDL